MEKVYLLRYQTEQLFVFHKLKVIDSSTLCCLQRIDVIMNSVETESLPFNIGGVFQGVGSELLFF